MIADIPSLPIDEALEDPNADEDFEDPNDRRPMRLLDSRRQADGDLSDSDDEGEGGRRNHARYRERDIDEPNGSHKFGLGGGILNAGSMNSHGAGPSGHTTAVRILSSATAESNSMEVDTPSADSNAGGSGTEAPVVASSATAAPPAVESPTTIPAKTEVPEQASEDKMVVDSTSTPAH